MTSSSSTNHKIMRVLVRPRSQAETRRHPRATQPAATHDELAAGLQPTPSHDLRFRGGRTIAHLAYVNFFVGGSQSWNQSDVDRIDAGLSRAMSDPGLNNVMRQYFVNQPISTTFVGSHFVGRARPRRVTESSAQRLIRDLFRAGQLSGLSFPSTVVNLLLPAGTVLTDGNGPGGEDRDSDDAQRRAKTPGIPEAEEASSLEGLGGFHGSVDIVNQRIYYAVGVFSQRLADGRENGIAVFDQPWKNVVATFYHELNEARTDPDVDDAIRTGVVDGIIGWNSDAGEECGDFPVFEAGRLGDLGLVFQEVDVAAGTAPVQFEYSNAVHGPEGPIATPHPLIISHDMV